MIELKDCPHCGGRAYLYTIPSINHHFVECKDCGASTMMHDTDEQAEDAWNKRTNE